jgi:Cys-rich repeat protein
MDQTFPGGNSNTPGGPADAPNAPPGVGLCQSDDDCIAPDVCNTAAGRCVPPSAKNGSLCDLIEGLGCPEGEQCISGVCMQPPGTCGANDECPAGFICVGGVCQPATKGGCTTDADCPSGQICVNGECKPKDTCQSSHNMGGTWRLDSKLHVRDGLKGLAKGVLETATTLQNIIDGKFSIKGVPSVVSSVIAGILQNTIQNYVPPWAKEVVKVLAAVDDVIDDTRVVSLEFLTPLGNDKYTAQSEWEKVEFEFKGVKVSASPQQIPGMGKVTTTGSYIAQEVCGVLFFDKHQVKNGIGKIYRWAVESIVIGVACLAKGAPSPCYPGVKAMLNDLIDCPKLASAVGGQNSLPGLESLVLTTCNAEKGDFINLLVKELDDLASKIDYMTLTGKADIQDPQTLVNGNWNGVLGGGFGKGNFEGTFTGAKVP